MFDAQFHTASNANSAIIGNSTDLPAQDVQVHGVFSVELSLDPTLNLPAIVPKNMPAFQTAAFGIVPGLWTTFALSPTVELVPGLRHCLQAANPA